MIQTDIRSQILIDQSANDACDNNGGGHEETAPEIPNLRVRCAIVQYCPTFE